MHIRIPITPSRTLALALAVLSLGIAVRAQSPAPARSVRDGVYSEAQAERGTSVYEGRCISCHVARMWGGDWTQKTAWDLFDTISNYMPEDNPGTLSPEQARDVLAYILKANRLPSGPKDLPDTQDGLKQIRIETPVR